MDFQNILHKKTNNFFYRTQNILFLKSMKFCSVYKEFKEILMLEKWFFSLNFSCSDKQIVNSGFESLTLSPN